MKTGIWACPLSIFRFFLPPKFLPTSGSNPAVDPLPGGLWWVSRNLHLRTTGVPPLNRELPCRVLLSPQFANPCTWVYLRVITWEVVLEDWGEKIGIRSPLCIRDSWFFCILKFWGIDGDNEGTNLTVTMTNGTKLMATTMAPNWWWQRRTARIWYWSWRQRTAQNWRWGWQRTARYQRWRQRHEIDDEGDDEGTKLTVLTTNGTKFMVTTTNGTTMNGTMTKVQRQRNVLPLTKAAASRIKIEEWIKINIQLKCD